MSSSAGVFTKFFVDGDFLVREGDRNSHGEESPPGEEVCGESSDVDAEQKVEDFQGAGEGESDLAEGDRDQEDDEGADSGVEGVPVDFHFFVICSGRCVSRAREVTL